MSHVVAQVELDPDDIAQWTSQPFEQLFTLSLDQVEPAQLEVLRRRFATLRPQVEALDKLASRQGVDAIDTIEDAAPLLFDHRVYKSYPMSILENRQFDRLTAWLDRLTTHDFSNLSVNGVTSVDAWLRLLDEHGMIMTHSTGTSGKLSFMPRSRTEWPAWEPAFFEAFRAASGIDRRTEKVVSFYPGYRNGYTTGTRLQRIFGQAQAGGEELRQVLYDYSISSDLLSLAARLRKAEERGEKLELDPELLQEQQKLIEAGRHREEDLERWFNRLATEFRGKRVLIDGVTGDLVRLAMKGEAEGIKCEFAPGSVLLSSGGMKDLKNAPEDWEGLLKRFFDVGRICTMYGMSETSGMAPICSHGLYHFMPYTVPFLLDADGNVLPREGTQTGRFSFVDLIAQSYWGGFVSGDKLTIHWDEECECGWKGPRAERAVARFSELSGEDDKISCAGTEAAYNEFMDYVGNI